jgi:hypothetical protein
MTENRYLTVLLTGDIQDTVNNELLKGSSIARRLNELNDENKELKKQVDEMINIFNDSGLDYHISDELEEILND